MTEESRSVYILLRGAGEGVSDLVREGASAGNGR